MPTSPDFEAALKLVLQYEGGYTNDPQDSGGPTNYGIIQAEYDAYRHRKGEAAHSVRDISMDEVRDIYFNQYWLVVHCQGLAAPLDEVMFDTAVNFGTGRAIEFLNDALGIPVAGMHWQNATSDAVHKADPKRLAVAVCDQRIAYRYHRVRQNGSQDVFLNGWLARDHDLKARALAVAS